MHKVLFLDQFPIGLSIYLIAVGMRATFGSLQKLAGAGEPMTDTDRERGGGMAAPVAPKVGINKLEQ